MSETIFVCTNCGQSLCFENSFCPECGTKYFLDQSGNLISLSGISETVLYVEKNLETVVYNKFSLLDLEE